MMEIAGPGLQVLLGIAVCSALQQLWSVFGVGPRKSHAVMAATCALAAVGIGFEARLLGAVDEAAFLGALRANLDAMLLSLATLPWVVRGLTRVGSPRLLWLLSAPLCALVAVNHALPVTLQYERFDGLVRHALPWGEVISRGRGQAGPWAYAGMALIVCVFAYACFALARHYRRTRDRGALWILSALVLYFAFGCEGLLARLGVVDFPELGPVGFMVLVVVMSAAATRAGTRRLQVSEGKFHALFADSPHAMLALDAANGRVLEANAAARRVLGYPLEEIRGKPLLELAWPQERDGLREELAQIVDGATARQRKDRWFLTREGERILLDCSVSLSKGEDGAADRVILSASDITERRRVEQALARSEARVRAIVEQSPVAISCSRGGSTIEVNASYVRMYGFTTAEELVGSSVLDRYAPQVREDIRQRISQRARGEPMEPSFESIGLRRDGTQFPLLVYAEPVELADGPATFAFLIDMSEQRAAQERIRRLAFFDQLTGLANRQLLADRLQRALALGARHGRHGALMQLDLDKFKMVNETLGPAEGDKLLQEVAARLVASVRSGDTVARVGGDKFAVLLEELGEQQAQAIAQAEAVGDAIVRAVARRVDLQGQVVRSTCSVGITLFRDPRQNPEELLKQADIAMYEAKDQGRNTLRFFDPRMQELIDARVALEDGLHQALEAGQFELHYQVQVDSAFLPIGAEALLRWIHPQRGCIMPGRFIGLAEETELIIPIGLWVLDAACARLRQWRETPLARNLTLAINVSAKQFRRPGFVEDVRAAIDRHGIDPALLKLELTESTLVEDIEATVATMQALRELGVKFSLDDFGTGYSSMQYLKRLPLDQLKIDQSFVRDLAVDPSDFAIVRTMIAMAHSLNVDVIAEGVETERQRDLLLQSGCMHFQGYLFGQPVPERQFLDFVEANLIGHHPGRQGRAQGLAQRG